MTKFQVFISEQEVVKLVLEFLEKRKLHISQLSVERETGIINGEYSEDALFFRQLILDGQWDSALDFVDPLNSYPEFNSRHFRYLILKHKYFELLCIKTEPGPMQNNEFTVDEIVECLHSLESVCPSADEYRQLRALLTLPALTEHDQFRHWNPSSARIECFNAVYPLVRQFLSIVEDSQKCTSSKNERLMQLLVKGMLYESCVDYCQNKALAMTAIDSTSSKPRPQPVNLCVKVNKLLSDLNTPIQNGDDLVEASSTDLSLVCWLECLPKESFGVQFVQKTLDLKCEVLRRPQLEALWTEQILVTPIKPMMFPHAAVPSGRLKSAEKMSRSMIPQYDGLASGLGNASSPLSSRGGVGGVHSKQAPHRDSLLSQSIAVGFQLTGKQLMQQSAIDVLFDNSTAQTRNSAGNPIGPVASIGQPSQIQHQQQQQQMEIYSGVSNSMPTLQQAQQQSIYFPHQYQQHLEVIEETSALGHQSSPIHQQQQQILLNEQSDYNQGQPQSLTARQQLDEIRRRSASPHLMQQAKPVDLTRSVMVDGPRQQGGGGRLYQEFNSKQQRVARCGSEPPGAGSMSPALPIDGLTYQMMQMSFHAQQHQLQQQPQQQQTMEQQQFFPQYGNQNQAFATSTMQGSIRSNGQQRNSFDGGSMASTKQQRQLGFRTSQNGSLSDDSGVVSYRSGSIGGSGGGNSNNNNDTSKQVQFVAVNRLEDQQAIRAVSFHPSGRYYAVGTNSRQLHVCRYPEVKLLKPDHVTKPPETLLLRPKQHRGSVYCVGFNPTGELLATGSNDKAVRLMKFDAETCKIGPEFELTMHDGTVRDLVFMEDTSNRTSLLISGGAGNCRIHLTDCATGMALRQLYGHTAPVLGLYTWGGCMFVSCSQDKTIRFWDLRCAEAVNMIAPSKATSSSPVTSICVDPGGRLLVSGHEDASIMLYDMRGSHVVQSYRPHVDEVRTVRFSPGTYYLLSGSYDKKITITDIRGNLLEPLKYLPVAEHEDKVIQCRWHPHDFTFLSTSADRSVILWALPPPQMVD